jgi:hypothetical protein
MREPNRMLFTEASLNALLRNGRPQRQAVHWDTRERGLCVLVSRGPKHARRATVTFRVLYYMKDRPGEARYFKLGRYPDELSDIEAVRDQARMVRIDAKSGIDPKKPKLTGKFPETVARFIEEYAGKNRTVKETERIFNRYVTKEWADKNIEEISREDVNTLLNRIARKAIEFDGQKHGTQAMAWATRSQLTTLFNWYEAKHTVSAEYRNPIPKVLKHDRLKPSPARERALSDEEIRALWIASGELGTYGALCRTALLTAQRFRRVARMRRAELQSHYHVAGEDIGHVWNPKTDNEAKNKKTSLVPLSGVARSVIASVPVIAASQPEDFVFTHDGRRAIQGWAKNKGRLDDRMLALLQQWAIERGDDPGTVELPKWQARDLRRTARTLLARLGVASDVAEHALGHVLSGIVQVYNRHDYAKEKRAAFEKLAALVTSIANPSPTNVIDIKQRV